MPIIHLYAGISHASYNEASHIHRWQGGVFFLLSLVVDSNSTVAKRMSPQALWPMTLDGLGMKYVVMWMETNRQTTTRQLALTHKK